ncbi:MAG TPA: hypothetical protein VGE06_07235 [Flavisolibacter sp.]
MKAFLFALLLLPVVVFGQSTKEAVYFCLDHPGRTLYFSKGKAVVKKGLDKKEFYQYGFMKWKGWINKNWATLQYDFRFLPAAASKQTAPSFDSLFTACRAKGYALKNIPMPYPMKPYTGYKKNGTN